jgi:hypothetical protein
VFLLLITQISKRCLPKFLNFLGSYLNFSPASPDTRVSSTRDLNYSVEECPTGRHGHFRRQRPPTTESRRRPPDLAAKTSPCSPVSQPDFCTRFLLLRRPQSVMRSTTMPSPAVLLIAPSVQGRAPPGPWPLHRFSSRRAEQSGCRRSHLPPALGVAVAVRSP